MPIADFTATKALFDLPDGVIYLDGNSLGPLPRAVPARLEAVLREEWGKLLITGWNKAGWMAAPSQLGDRIGRLIGAEAGSVVIGDTLSVKVCQALAAALKMRPGRKIILSDSGNFPSDLYMAQGLVQGLGQGHALHVVAPEAVADALTEDAAVLMLTQVDYRTGRLHDMAALTARAHELGIVTLWDLAHSAGALPVHLADCGVDFAVGCTYKYLNAGPGAPAFIYVAPRHADHAEPLLSGWLGHAQPFDFEADYRPGKGIERMRVGTPPVLQMAALDVALDIWEGVDLAQIREASIALTERFIKGVEARCRDLRLVSPRDPDQRGSQVSFAHPEGYAIMQALIARGVIGDFRAPDVIRFGFTPLYIGAAEVDAAITILAQIMEGRQWDQDRYRIRAAVT